MAHDLSFLAGFDGSDPAVSHRLGFVVTIPDAQCMVYLPTFGLDL